MSEVTSSRAEEISRYPSQEVPLVEPVTRPLPTAIQDIDGHMWPAQLYAYPSKESLVWLWLAGSMTPFAWGLPTSWARAREMLIGRTARLPEQNPTWSNTRAQLLNDAIVPDVRELRWASVPAWIDEIRETLYRRRLGYRVSLRRVGVDPNLLRVVSVTVGHGTLWNWKRFCRVVNPRVGWAYRLSPFRLTQYEWEHHVRRALNAAGDTPCPISSPED